MTVKHFMELIEHKPRFPMEALERYAFVNNCGYRFHRKSENDVYYVISFGTRIFRYSSSGIDEMDINSSELKGDDFEMYNTYQMVRCHVIELSADACASDKFLISHILDSFHLELEKDITKFTPAYTVYDRQGNTDKVAFYDRLEDTASNIIIMQSSQSISYGNELRMLLGMSTSQIIPVHRDSIFITQWSKINPMENILDRFTATIDDFTKVSQKCRDAIPDIRDIIIPSLYHPKVFYKIYEEKLSWPIYYINTDFSSQKTW